MRVAGVLQGRLNTAHAYFTALTPNATLALLAPGLAN